MSYNDHFALWMSKLDELVYNAIGISIHDLPDMQFRDAFDAGDTPEEFAAENLGYNGDGSFDYNVLNDLLFG